MQKKICIADDNVDTLEVLAHLLGIEGYQVVTAPDGLVALELAQKGDCDLLVTDINMPNMDGISLIKRLRQDPKMGCLPIMAVSAYGPEILGGALEAGADKTLTKPFGFDSFTDTIAALLHNCRGKQADTSGVH